MTRRNERLNVRCLGELLKKTAQSLSSSQFYQFYFKFQNKMFLTCFR